MSDPGDSSGIAEGPDPEPDQRSWITADIVEDGGDWSGFPNVETLIELATEVVAGAPELAIGAASVAIALSSDSNVRKLNAAYRGFDKPTNVLSFPAPPGIAIPGEPRFLGDIVLAAETVLAEAEARDISPADHLRHLVVHGLLHLLGFDHETDEEADRMERLETTLLARLGIADPHIDLAD